ncbi:right-handed parallel beta-helix repeat-containing protein [Luteolibacter flavescens]|uniref:Right-handed parallel beta-helix repeat-containing protein n=1 Tax=Luteolibacter flavescens TaxID=1859460 RepID=A0ABT3FUV7_9BACT|nr:right-handed parallel beta-helix repeat-containing protein [Luteolibacter flavescens]MCW1887342.1 right-handed parallel beta-helix repeat-containing protein [Luteolibacter flavescens]
MRFLLPLLLASAAHAATWYVAPDGSDHARGDRPQPFATVQRAQAAASPGDTVILRGGTYAMQESMIARRERIWAYVTLLDKSGKPGKPITYRAETGEQPVFDLSAVKPAGLRVHAFEVKGSHLVLQGISVTGVQVTAAHHTQSICFSNTGSHNRYERLRMHDGMGIGFYLSRGSNNLVLNCDAWNNYDPVSEGGRGGNVDGFGGHPNRGDTGNVFRGCRAWFNSDDGFDCISAWESIRFENCWAWQNGKSPDGKSLGDGNGFKIGGFGLEAKRGLPDPMPRHTVIRCVAASNKANGFYANHHPGGSNWIHNSAYANRTNFNFLGRDFSTHTGVPGSGHIIRNNIGFGSRNELAQLDREKCQLAGNIFGERLETKDFLSLDVSLLAAPRQKDGSLPHIDFMRPAPKGKMVDAGEKGAEPFNGKAPDAGAIESGST